jgi:hypothetical protein
MQEEKQERPALPYIMEAYVFMQPYSSDLKGINEHLREDLKNSDLYQFRAMPDPNKSGLYITFLFSGKSNPLLEINLNIVKNSLAKLEQFKENLEFVEAQVDVAENFQGYLEVPDKQQIKLIAAMSEEKAFKSKMKYIRDKIGLVQPSFLYVSGTCYMHNAFAPYLVAYTLILDPKNKLAMNETTISRVVKSITI